jgi:hypothetical protein
MSLTTDLKNFVNEITFTSFMKYLILIIIYTVILVSNLLVGHYIKNPLRSKGIGQCLDVPISEEYEGLPDVLHFDNKKINNITEIISNTALMLCVTFFFISFFPNNARNLRIIFLFTTLAVVGFLIRVLAFSVTVPPPPVKQDKEEAKNFFDMIFNEGNPRAAFSDFMFSGHAFFIVLSLLFIWNYRKIIGIYTYSTKLFYFIYLSLFILSIIAIPSISLSGLHYSSDVVIGVASAILLFLAKNNFAMKLDYKDLV